MTWEQINAAGIVFLPDAYYRYVISGNTSVAGGGHYWSSTTTVDNTVQYTYAFQFSASEAPAVVQGRIGSQVGFSIRLVSDAK